MPTDTIKPKSPEEQAGEIAKDLEPKTEEQATSATDNLETNKNLKAKETAEAVESATETAENERLERLNQQTGNQEPVNVKPPIETPAPKLTPKAQEPLQQKPTLGDVLGEPNKPTATSTSQISQEPKTQKNVSKPIIPKSPKPESQEDIEAGNTPWYRRILGLGPKKSEEEPSDPIKKAVGGTPEELENAVEKTPADNEQNPESNQQNQQG